MLGFPPLGWRLSLPLFQPRLAQSGARNVREIGDGALKQPCKRPQYLQGWVPATSFEVLIVPLRDAFDLLVSQPSKPAGPSQILPDSLAKGVELHDESVAGRACALPCHYSSLCHYISGNLRGLLRGGRP